MAGRRPSGLPSVNWARRRRVVCAGNAVVYRVGSGTGSLVATGNPVFLDEYSPTGTRIQTIALPTAAAGAQKALLASGTALPMDSSRFRPTAPASSCPDRARSGTGSAISPPRARSRAAGHSARRGARDAAGRDRHYDGPHRRITAEQFPKRREQRLRERLGFGNCGNDRWRRALHDDRIDHFGGSHGYELREHACGCRPPRTALRLGVGHGAPGGGKRRQRCSHFGPADSREASRTAGSRGQRTAVCILLHASRSRSPGADTLYVADESFGVAKDSLVAGSWIANGTAGAGADAYRGITGTTSGTTVTLFATRKGGSTATGGGELVSIVDASGYNGAFTGAPTLLAVAGANTAFRGVAMVPQSPRRPHSRSHRALARAAASLPRRRKRSSRGRRRSSA